MAALETALPGFASTLPEDLVWLAENQGSPYTATTCRTILRELRPDAARHQRDLAEVRHSLGTRLIDLVTHGAVETFERSSLAAFLESDCGMDPHDGYDCIRFAKGTTAAEATRYGFTRCRIGVTLVKQLGLRGLGELATRTLEVPAGDGGPAEKIVFAEDTPVSKLRRALAHLRATAADEPEPPSRATARRMRLYGELVEEYVEKYPVLASAGLRATLYAGKARVQHKPLSSPEQFAAVAKFYAELSKLR